MNSFQFLFCEFRKLAVVPDPPKNHRRVGHLLGLNAGSDDLPLSARAAGRHCGSCFQFSTARPATIVLGCSSVACRRLPVVERISPGYPAAVSTSTSMQTRGIQDQHRSMRTSYVLKSLAQLRGSFSSTLMTTHRANKPGHKVDAWVY